VSDQENGPKQGAIYVFRVGSSAALRFLDDDVTVRQALLGRHFGATASVTTTVGINTRAMVAPIVAISIITLRQRARRAHRPKRQYLTNNTPAAIKPNRNLDIGFLLHWA
jgi:hypothetical protein